jgi:hypothetical protein
MSLHLQSPAGSTVLVSLVPATRVALDAGFDWQVTDLTLTASVLPLSAGCTDVLRGLPVALKALDPAQCQTEQASVELSARFRAPFTTGAYRLVFQVSSRELPDLFLELDAGQLFVTASSSRGSRAPGHGLISTPLPSPPPSVECSCECQDQVVDTLAERDLIPLNQRCEAIFLVYVRQDDSYWVLIGGIANTNWRRFDGGGGGSLPSIIRGGNADPNNFPPDARWVLY